MTDKQKPSERVVRRDVAFIQPENWSERPKPADRWFINAEALGEELDAMQAECDAMRSAKERLEMRMGELERRAADFDRAPFEPRQALPQLNCPEGWQVEWQVEHRPELIGMLGRVQMFRAIDAARVWFDLAGALCRTPSSASMSRQGLGEVVGFLAFEILRRRLLPGGEP